jgi:hypothetical protein
MAIEQADMAQAANVPELREDAPAGLVDGSGDLRQPATCSGVNAGVHAYPLPSGEITCLR